MEVVGLDVGRSNVKLYAGPGKQLTFPSIVGEWRDRRLQTDYPDGYEVEHKGKRYFIGELARRESEYSRQMMTDSKAHNDTLILALTALARAGINDALVVTGIPVRDHVAESKSKLKALLTDDHVISVNGSPSKVRIRRVEVAVEGGAAFWSYPSDGIVRIVDAGSKTINYVTMDNRHYVDRDSGTLLDADSRTYGFETTRQIDDESLAARIAGELTKRWKSSDTVMVSGGKAKELAQLLRSYFPKATAIPNALYANAIGYYQAGRRLV